MCATGRTWPWTPGAGAPIQAAVGQRWHVVGDSITAPPYSWYDATGGLVDQVETLIGGAIVTTASGAGGEKVITLASTVHDRVAVYEPDVVVVEMGFNDVPFGTPLPTFRAAYDSILYGIRAECPNAQILCVSIFVFFEQWLSGPLRWDSSSDFGVDGFNLKIAESCAAYGAAYADIRAAALLYEQANNTPEPGALFGVLTDGGIHPTTAGSVVMGTKAMEYVEAA